MQVLPWSYVVFGSLIGPAVGVAALWLLGERRVRSLSVAGVGVCAGTWLWNSMLNIRHAGVIDGDVPFKPFPISWQDTGTGVFAFAFAACALLATTERDEPGRRTLRIAGIAALAAFVMDVYTW
ncbi:MAG: hypothetical protein HY826_06420 [Actinobacteria bacterium]|nr:hypothetical protein [Actinomycetota bacterium]